MELPPVVREGSPLYIKPRMLPGVSSVFEADAKSFRLIAYRLKLVSWL